MVLTYLFFIMMSIFFFKLQDKLKFKKSYMVILQKNVRSNTNFLLLFTHILLQLIG